MAIIRSILKRERETDRDRQRKRYRQRPIEIETGWEIVAFSLNVGSYCQTTILVSALNMNLEWHQRDNEMGLR